MANYVNTYSGQTRSSDTFLGYPYVEIDSGTGEPVGAVEFGVATAAAILAEVGDDPVLAQAALDAEAARETPRVVLTRDLKAIIAAAES